MKNYSNPDGLVREDFSGGWDGDKSNKFTAPVAENSFSRFVDREVGIIKKHIIR